MGEYKNKAYPLRIDGRLMEKLKIIADENNRTKNKEIEYALRKYVDIYEAQHGEIKIDDHEIEEQQRKEKAMERARNERNYNNYLRRKERYERQAYRQVNNQVPITAVIYAIVLILVIVCICLANQGYNVLDIIRYFIEKQ